MYFLDFMVSTVFFIGYVSQLDWADTVVHLSYGTLVNTTQPVVILHLAARNIVRIKSIF